MTHNNYERREFWNNLSSMKATIEYNLSDPDEQMAHLRAVKSTDMAIVLFQLIRNSRKDIAEKYDDASKDFMEGVEAVMTHIQELCEEYGINIDDLLD